MNEKCLRSFECLVLLWLLLLMLKQCVLVELKEMNVLKMFLCLDLDILLLLSSMLLSFSFFLNLSETLNLLSGSFIK